MPLPELKPFYYLDHFEEVLAFLEQHYFPVLQEEHRALLRERGQLSRKAQALYVRMVNRKGLFFRRSQMRYDELGDLDPLWEELQRGAWAEPLSSESFASFLAARTKTEILDWLRRTDVGGRGLASKSKAIVLEVAQRKLSFERWRQLPDAGDVVVQGRSTAMAFLLFLYFGRLQDNLSDFTMRDLGLLRTSEGTGDFKPRYTDAATADSAFHYARMKREVKELSVEQAVQLAATVDNWPMANEGEIQRRRQEVIQRLGSLLEKHHQKEAALSVYEHSEQHPGVERRVRLTYQIHGKEAARPLLDSILEDPDSDSSLLFAEHFLAQKYEGRRLGALTTLLREAPVLQLDESGRGAPETGAVAWHRRQGREAWWVENQLWMSLFRLLFWELLFGTKATRHNSFDRLPSPLLNNTFWKEEGDAIRQNLDLLDEPERLRPLLEERAKVLGNRPFDGFPVDRGRLDLVIEFACSAPPPATRRVLEAMAADFQHRRQGFPDLLLREQGRWRFLEIKAEGDQLRRNQLQQILLLQEAGFEVGVERVAWSFDPDQEYVIVDVETTGQSPQKGRLTEVGAVRIRGEEVIGEWQSLINPGRRIPRFITRLTGIDDAMVKEAPSFSEVADSLREFLHGAVFVAHNASFDHGFLRAEYGRLDQKFSMPTLCTRVQTRRHFPGLPSYGLAKLCDHFEIELTDHHRALCDARATAELLKRINRRRREAADA